MAQSKTSAPSEVVKTYYEKRLLDRLESKLQYAQFADKRPIPRNAGKTIEFTRYTNFAALTANLTEGTVPTAQTLSASTVTASLIERGGFIEMSDLLLGTKIDPKISEQVDLMGYQAALTVDTYGRGILTASATTQFAGSKASLSTVGPTDVLNFAEIRQAATTLRKNDAMPISGSDFVAVAHPSNLSDLMSDTASNGWLEAVKYTNPSGLFNGEVGKVYGVRIVESTNVSSTATGTSASATVYDVIVMGQHSWAMTELGGKSVELFITPSGPNVADPLRQKSTVGWKWTGTAKVLDANRLINIRAASAA